MGLKDQLVHVDLMATQEHKVKMALMEKMVMKDLLAHLVSLDTVIASQENKGHLEHLEIKDRRYLGMH